MFFFKPKKKRIKVPGKIVGFELINGKHYPLFSYTTLDGRVFDRVRAIPKDPNIEECSVEDAYVDNYVNEYLQQPLPIGEIDIKYLEEDPSDFYAVWI